MWGATGAAQTRDRLKQLVFQKSFSLMGMFISHLRTHCPDSHNKKHVFVEDNYEKWYGKRVPSNHDGLLQFLFL
jgi:hypothetical protein